jgi:hypothetical protein
MFRGSTVTTGTPASFALYSTNPLSSANDQFDILSRSGLPEPRPFADARQLFNGDAEIRAFGFLNELFRDAKIGVCF